MSNRNIDNNRSWVLRVSQYSTGFVFMSSDGQCLFSVLATNKTWGYISHREHDRCFNKFIGPFKCAKTAFDAAMKRLSGSCYIAPDGWK